MRADTPSRSSDEDTLAHQLLRGPAAVEQDVCAGDEARFFGAKEQRQLADFFHVTPPADRNLRYELCVQFRIVENGAIQLGCERTGTDPVDRDFFGC